MSDIEKVIEAGRIAVRQEGATLKTVAKALLEDSPYEEYEDLKPAAKVEMTDELVHALTVLPAVFGSHQVEVIRQLTEQERRDLGEEQIILEQVVKPLTKRVEAIKETVRHHMDLVAVAEGKVGPDADRDSHGHYVVAAPKKPEQVEIPGQNKVWSREYRSGTVEIDGSKLLEMYENGEIDRATYLAMTREVRVFDEDKAFRAMAKDPGLIGVFRKIIKKGRPGTSLYLRKK